MRPACPLGDASGDTDRPIRAGSDQPVDLERADQPLDRRLVLGGENAATIGEPESGRARVAVDDGDPDSAVACGFEQPQLRWAGA